MYQDIFQKYSIRAKKSLGQNFLVDEKILSEIASSTEVFGKNIVEVGPGYGALTEKLLLKKPKSLSLIELDREMIEILEHRKVLGELDTKGIEFQILHQDILTFLPKFGGEAYSVVANIPYYITSPILRHFLYDIDKLPETMLILMQKDVADKILGGKNPHPNPLLGERSGKRQKQKSSVLSLFIEKKSSVSEKIYVPKESFIPAPKIQSSVLLFEIHDRYSKVSDDIFLKLIKSGFAEPRKKLTKNLIKAGYDGQKVLEFLKQRGLDDNFRGEDGDIDFWVEITMYIFKI